jgi:hypothetical protein
MTVLVNKTANYSGNFVDFEPPIDMTGVTGFFLFGDTAAKSIKNWGTGGDATVVGAPVFGAQFARFTGPGAYLQTNIAQAVGDVSVALVCKASVAAPAGTARPCYLSNAVAGGQGLTWFQSVGPNDAVAISQADATQASLCQIVNNTSDVPQFMTFRYDDGPGGSSRLKSYTRNLTGASGQPSIAVNPAAAKYRIGMNYSANLLGPADLALLVIANRLWTDAEEDALYAWAKKVMTLRGVTV